MIPLRQIEIPRAGRFNQWAAIALMALAVIPRVVRLDERPVIHDESMFAYYAWSFMESGHYSHMPILHGPTLILATGRLFSWVGDSIAVARAGIAAVSLLALAAALALWPRRFRWWFAPVLFTSPILLYYSRFLRNDMLFSTLLLLGLLGLSRGLSRRGRSSLWAALGVACLIALIAVKENALFFWASLVSFGLLYGLRRLAWQGPAYALRPRRRLPPRPLPAAGPPARLQRGTYMNPTYASVVGDAAEAPFPDRNSSPSYQSGVSARPRFKWRIGGWWVTGVGWFLGAVLGCAFVLLIYGMTTSSENPTALANLRASWDYWKGQHEIHRISGPIHYYLPILLVYELPVLLLILVGLIRDASLRAGRAAVYLASIVLWLMVWSIWLGLADVGPVARAADFLHIEPNASMLVLGLIIALILAWSVLQLEQHRVLASFVGWWAACSLFQYSSAGEKVPWLAVHIILPLLLMVGWVWGPGMRRMGWLSRSVMAGALLLTTLLAMRNDFYLIERKRDSDPRERIVYNHTSPEFDDFCRTLIKNWQIYSDDIQPSERRILFLGAPSWPGVWYFRHFNWTSPEEPPATLGPDIDLAIGDEHLMDALLRSLDQAEWNAVRMSLRNAWVPDWPRRLHDAAGPRPWRQALLEAFAAWWAYYWHRTPWSPTGEYPVIAVEPMTMRR